MKSIAFAMLLVIGVGLLAGPAIAGDSYSEKQEHYYTVNWDGSVAFKLVTIFYGPSDMLNKSKESIFKNGLENSTQLYLKQEIDRLSQMGITLKNASAKLIGYNTTGPLETIITGTAYGLAKYYSYGNVWEITLDPLMISEFSKLDPSQLNQTFDVENYYTIVLPKGAKILELPPSTYKKTAGSSYIQIQTQQEGNVIKVMSHIHLAKGITREQFQELYQGTKDYTVRYSGRTGSEGNYSKWIYHVDTNMTVRKNSTVLDTTMSYIQPQSYINYLKFQIVYSGEQKAIQSMYNSYVKQFESQGAKVLDGDIKLLNVNKTGPLIIKVHWVLQNYTKKQGDVYTYTYDPTLGMANIPSSFDRIQAEINESMVTRIVLPAGAKFTKIPKDIDVQFNGSRLTMKVEKVNDSAVIIRSDLFVRYGMYGKDYSAMMAKVPGNVTFQYTMSSGGSGNGICGPALIVGLAVLPLVLRRRK